MTTGDGPTGRRPDGGQGYGPQDVRPSGGGLEHGGGEHAPHIGEASLWAPKAARHHATVPHHQEAPLWAPQTGPEHHGAHAPAQVTTPNRKSSTMVKLGLTAAAVGAGVLVIAAIADDDDDEPTHAAVCVDRTTNERIDDDYCDDDRHGGGGGFVGWYFFSYGHSAPRVGGTVSGGSYTAPQGSTYVKGGVPRQGGVVSSSSVKGGSVTTSRGGFGGSAKGSGG